MRRTPDIDDRVRDIESRLEQVKKLTGSSCEMKESKADAVVGPIIGFLVVTTIAWASWMQIHSEFGLPAVSWLSVLCGWFVVRFATSAVTGLKRKGE